MVLQGRSDQPHIVKSVPEGETIEGVGEKRR